MPIDSNSHSRHRGFTITELIVVVAILSIVCVVGAAIAVNSQNASSYADRKNESLALGRQIIENLRFDSTCAQTLGHSSITQTGNPATEMVTPTGWQVRLKLEGINSGLSMTGTAISSNPAENQILGKRLNVNSLKLADGVLLDTTAGISRYLATIYLQTSAIGGISHRQQMLGTLTLNLNASNEIQSCQSITTNAFASACTDMGCTYNSSLTPPCRCMRSQVVCSAPGFYATSFNAEGIPVCEPAGGSDCPPNEYLAGFGIDEIQCTPAPTVTFVNGLCGGASGNTFFDATSANAAGLCSQGTASPVSLSGAGPWAWDCLGANGGTNASPQCTATQSASMINGACGTANGNSYANATAANTAGLCAQGNASPASLSGGGPWTWDCVGINGGTNASPQCGANVSSLLPAPTGNCYGYQWQRTNGINGGTGGNCGPFDSLSACQTSNPGPFNGNCGGAQPCYSTQACGVVIAPPNSCAGVPYSCYNSPPPVVANRCWIPVGTGVDPNPCVKNGPFVNSCNGSATALCGESGIVYSCGACAL